MYKDLSNHEGKLKKIHARVKLCSESIAFFGGGDREKQMVNERFERYMAKDWLRHWCTFKFSIIEDLFRSRIPETLQWYWHTSTQRRCSVVHIAAIAKDGDTYQKMLPQFRFVCLISAC